MDLLKVQGVMIDGVVACLPENKINNRDACAKLYGEGVDTLIKATGIISRYTANSGTTSLDLNIAAAKELLDKTNTKVEDFGAVICVTFTPEHLMPADAPSAQSRLGLSQHCMAFDINMACSGYGYGLYIASILVNTLKKKVLLLNGDTQTVFVSQDDKATFPVLSDVGTATILSPDGSGADWIFSFYTDGSRKDVLLIPFGGTKQPVTHDSLEYKSYEDGSKRRNIDMYMNGFEVYKFVAIDVSKFLQQFLNESKINLDDIDAFVPHQANIYMITQLAKKLNFKAEKLWKSGDVYGNPASASVPLTIAENARKWFINKENGNILLAGFGGGLSISAGNILLKSEAYYNVIQYR